MSFTVRLTFACLMLATAGSAADAREYQFQRWALVSSRAVQELGLSDLLTAELSSQPGMELVERDQLQEATKELELSLLLGARQAGSLSHGRQALGKLLRADALVLLSLTKRQDSSFLRMVVCDCITGARLRVDYLPYDAKNTQAIVKQCTASVLQTRRRFASGVRKLIGVTPFLSKNLRHDDDNLQIALPALIEDSLGRFPGKQITWQPPCIAIRDC